MASQSVINKTHDLEASFTNWCRDELFTPEMREATALLQQACDLHLLGIYRTLNLAEILKSPKTASEVVQTLGFVESASTALEAVLLRLAHRTNIVHAEFSQEPPLFIGIAEPGDRSVELQGLRKHLMDGGYSAATEFLDFGAEHFISTLKDDPEFMDRVLTARESQNQELWFRATNADPLQNVHGVMGARWVESVFGGGRILEIGGGTGNGTRHLLRKLSEKHGGPRIESYIFSDISLGFIMATRKELRDLYPGIPIEWRHLDINKSFGAQKLAPKSMDMIFGVNAAHVARDIVGFLKECYTALRPAGKIVFAERVRMNGQEMAPRELTLNLSSYHRTAAIRDAQVRPVHGYLSPECWLRALHLAGFEHSQLLPDLNAMAAEFPDQYAAVVYAVK